MSGDVLLSSIFVVSNNNFAQLFEFYVLDSLCKWSSQQKANLRPIDNPIKQILSKKDKNNLKLYDE